MLRESKISFLVLRKKKAMKEMLVLTSMKTKILVPETNP
jgi:hypothetical protein